MRRHALLRVRLATRTHSRQHTVCLLSTPFAWASTCRPADTVRRSWIQILLSYLPWGATANGKVNASDKDKRQLTVSSLPVLVVSWPFLFWALLVIIVNVFGWTELRNISSPIAISNVRAG